VLLLGIVVVAYVGTSMALTEVNAMMIASTNFDVSSVFCFILAGRKHKQKSYKLRYILQNSQIVIRLQLERNFGII
jgi:hypothetical protein